MQFQLNKKSFIYLIVLVLLVIVLVYTYWIRPVQTETNEVQATIEEKRNELRLLQVEQKQIKKTAAMDKSMLHNTRVHVPEAPYENQIIESLRIAEVSSGLNMEEYKIATSGNNGTGTTRADLPSNITVIPVNVKLRGTSKQLDSFMKELETSDRLFQIKNVKYQADSNPPVSVRDTKREIQCEIDLLAFYAPSMASAFDRPMTMDSNAPKGVEDIFTNE